MDIRILSPSLNLKETLKDRTIKKLSTFYDRIPDLISVEVTYKRTRDVEKNKAAEVRLRVPGNDLFAKKQGLRFETALDECIDALRKQWEKQKGK
jgi:ribosome-associated translation inhibitor RaiA